MNNIFFSKKNKFNARKVKYNGRIYDSALECDYAIELDWRKKAGEILEVFPQYKLDLSVYGTHICNYFVDFRIILPSGEEQFHEVKGCETDLWRFKWRLAKAMYGKEKFYLIK